MGRLQPIFVGTLFLAACGCTDRGKQVYQSANGDLGDFIVKSAPQLGVHLVTSNGLPSVPAKWCHRATSDTLEVIVEGDCYPQLHAFLTNAVGPLQGHPVTNRLQANEYLESYYGTNVGATVCCRSDVVEGGKRYTSFVIIGYGQSAADQASFAQMMRMAAEKGADSDRALDAARPSAPYVSDVVRLFPDAEVRHRNFDASLGFDVVVDLHGRYELTIQLPVVFDPAHRNVIGYGEPKFYLVEAASVIRNKSGIAETTLNPESERHFGSAEWRKVVEAGGNFGAIGYKMLTNRPVQGFKGRNLSVER